MPNHTPRVFPPRDKCSVSLVDGETLILMVIRNRKVVENPGGGEALRRYTSRRVEGNHKGKETPRAIRSCRVGENLKG